MTIQLREPPDECFLAEDTKKERDWIRWIIVVVLD